MKIANDPDPGPAVVCSNVTVDTYAAISCIYILHIREFQNMRVPQIYNPFIQTGMNRIPNTLGFDASFPWQTKDIGSSLYTLYTLMVTSNKPNGSDISLRW